MNSLAFVFPPTSFYFHYLVFVKNWSTYFLHVGSCTKNLLVLLVRATSTGFPVLQPTVEADYPVITGFLGSICSTAAGQNGRQRGEVQNLFILVIRTL
jgi:hypothetical protein